MRCKEIHANLLVILPLTVKLLIVTSHLLLIVTRFTSVYLSSVFHAKLEQNSVIKNDTVNSFRHNCMYHTEA